MDRFETEPAVVLAELHTGLNPTDDEDKLFALAELSLLHAENTADPSYFLASAVYAWSLLFPGDDSGVQLEASDPRLRLAYDLYNQGLAQGLAVPGKADEIEVQLKPGEYRLPFGTLKIALDESGLSWGGYQLEHFVSTASLGVRGLRNRYRSPGLGTSLAASIAPGPASAKVLGSERLGPAPRCRSLRYCVSGKREPIWPVDNSMDNSRYTPMIESELSTLMANNNPSNPILPQHLLTK